MLLTVVLEKALKSPLDCKEIQPVHPKGIFIGRTDVEAETPILWLPDAKNWLIWKDPDAGENWMRVEKGMTEDEMVGWHNRLDGHGFGWTLGVDDGHGGLVCCGSRGWKESDTTWQLNNRNNNSTDLTGGLWGLNPNCLGQYIVNTTTVLCYYAVITIKSI